MHNQGQILNLPIDIKRSGYAVYAKGGEDNTAEIKMYGEVCRTRPFDYWTGKPADGNFIVEEEILADLEKLVGKKEIRIRMNSVGGACNTAIVIHNKLREMSVNGTKIICTVDGVAMSAGSHIMCAADVVKASVGSLVMIHKAISWICGWLNADDARNAVEKNDAYDKVIASAYVRKTGKSEEELLAMMSATTYLTGREAKEKGFVDELIEDDESTAQVAASADRKTLYCNGQAMFLGNMCVPDFIPTVIPPNANANASADGAIINNQSDNDTDENKNGGNLMANNLKELRAENSALASAVEADIKAELETTLAAEKTEAINKAIADERQRLSDIDEIASLYNAEIVQEAKYGEKACNAAELALRAAKQQTKTGDAFMKGVTEDFGNSGAEDVGAAPEPNQGGAMTEEQRRAAIDKSVDELGLEEGE